MEFYHGRFKTKMAFVFPWSYNTKLHGFSDILTSFLRSLRRCIFDPDLESEVKILKNTSNIFEYNLPY